MSKELKALERIKREAGIPYFSSLYDIDMWREDFQTIETALKALEIIRGRLLFDEDMGIIQTKDEPTFGKVAHLHSITFQILSDEEEYYILKEVLK